MLSQLINFQKTRLNQLSNIKVKFKNENFLVFFKVYRFFNNLLSIFYSNKFSLQNNVILKNRHNKIFKEIRNILKVTPLKKKITSFDNFTNFRREIMKILNNSRLLGNFLKNPEIQKIMFGTNRFFFYLELLELKNDYNWNLIWKKNINENYIGNPIPYFLYPESSGNRIHDLFHLKYIFNFREKINKINTIFEFGGGYGNLCHLINKILKPKTYIIYDLPEVCLLQYYYLRMLGYEVNISQKSVKKKFINLIYNKDLIQINFLKKKELSKSLFISNWALSESPISLRSKFLGIINKTKLVFLAFQEKFRNIDNLNYFKNKIKEKTYFRIKKFKRLNEKHYYLWNINK
jgi:putative sugar O-methyltransferase